MKSFSPREITILSVLVIIQFALVLDFVIMMPLGPPVMRTLKISTATYGLLLASYTYSASVASLLAVFIIDRLDRKKLLLAVFAGFIAGTFVLALAESLAWVFAGRMIAGFFSGVLGSLIFTIVSDVIAEEKRGLAVGIVFSAFSAAMVVGLPTGVVLAGYNGWQFPFLVLALLSLSCFPAAILLLPQNKPQEQTENPMKVFLRLLAMPDVRKSFTLTGVLILSGFSIFSYLSPYLVHNVGLLEIELAWIYLAGGAFTVFTNPYAGRMADRYGKQRVFRIMALVTVPVLIGLTNLPPIPLWAVILCSTIVIITMQGRFTPMMALITSVPPLALRGSFLTINTFVREIASGTAAYIGGLLIVENQDGTFDRFWLVGIFSVCCTLTAWFLAGRIRTRSEREKAGSL